ncbi:hypothetical protein BRADI_1g03245v3, partial [Brachypodium distachyon]
METPTAGVVGMTFCPPELELTDLYLHDDIAGHPVRSAAAFFHRADIYSAEPEELVEGLQHAPGTDKGDKPQPAWYFLSPVRCVGRQKAQNSSSGKKMQRAVVEGKTWHMESQKPVLDSAVGGHVKTFSYVTSGPGRGRQRLGWIMKEYSISPENGGGDLVLCKIYRTNYGKKSSSAAAAVSNSGESSTNKKRKAASCEHPETLPSARPKQTHDQAQNYSAAAELYGATDQLPPWSTQDSFLQSSSELYTTSWITEELQPPCSTQDGFLPSSSELYEATSAYMPAGREQDLGLPSLTQEQVEPPPLPEDDVRVDSQQWDDNNGGHAGNRRAG